MRRKNRTLFILPRLGRWGWTQGSKWAWERIMPRWLGKNWWTPMCRVSHAHWAWMDPTYPNRAPTRAVRGAIGITGEDLDRWEAEKESRNRVACMALAYLSGVEVHDTARWHPQRFSDVVACCRLCQTIPQVRKAWPLLADVDPVWGRTVKYWAQLEQMSPEMVDGFLLELGCR